jgi:hypothetical protein
MKRLGLAPTPDMAMRIAKLIPNDLTEPKLLKASVDTSTRTLDLLVSHFTTITSAI